MSAQPVKTHDPNFSETETISEFLDLVYRCRTVEKLYMSFVFHITLYCMCCTIFRWRLRSVIDLFWYVTQIMRYVGYLCGIFSASTSLICLEVLDKIITSLDAVGESPGVVDKSLKIVFVLAAVSFLLSVAATVITYGISDEPDIFFGATVITACMCFPTLRAFITRSVTRALLLKTFGGIFHSILCLVLVDMSLQRLRATE